MCFTNLLSVTKGHDLSCDTLGTLIVTLFHIRADSGGISLNYFAFKKFKPKEIGN